MEKRREEKKNIAYNQKLGNLLGLSSEGVNNGHNIINNLIFTWREVEHTEEEKITPKCMKHHKAIFGKSADEGFMYGDRNFQNNLHSKQRK